MFSAEVESRTQDSRPKPRPRTQKNFEAKAKDRPSRGQGQGPRTQTQVFSKTKRSSKNFFRRSQKKRSSKTFFRRKRSSKNFFSADLYLRKPKKRSLQISRKVSGVFQRNFNGSKIVLYSSLGQANFRGLEASRPRPRLQNVSSRTSSTPRMSSRTPPLVLSIFSAGTKRKLETILHSSIFLLV